MFAYSLTQNILSYSLSFHFEDPYDQKRFMIFCIPMATSPLVPKSLAA